MTRVLITGATGLLGHALMAELQSAGLDPVGLGSADADLTDSHAAFAAFDRHQPEIVFHLAARVRGILGNAGVHGQAYLDNIRINTNTIEAARLAGARKIVAMGSAAIYSDLVPLPMREADLWHGPPHASEAGYAHAKRAMLAQLESYRDQWGLDYAYAISTNLYGPHDRFDEQHGHVIPSLISKFHRAARTGEPVTIWGTGTPRRDFLYVKDAARALLLLVDRFAGPINLATGRSVSIRDTAALIAEVSGYRGVLAWDTTKPDGQVARDYDIGQLTSLGFASGYSLRDGLVETLAWFDACNDAARR